MVVNLHRTRRIRADDTGWTWKAGYYRRDRINAGRYLCWLNGRNVTAGTFYVDSRRGILRRWKLDADGHRYVDKSTGKAAWEEVRGHVRLRRRPEYS